MTKLSLLFVIITFDAVPYIYIAFINISNLKSVCGIVSEISMLKKILVKNQIFIFPDHYSLTNFQGMYT